MQLKQTKGMRATKFLQSKSVYFTMVLSKILGTIIGIIIVVIIKIMVYIVVSPLIIAQPIQSYRRFRDGIRRKRSNNKRKV